MPIKAKNMHLSATQSALISVVIPVYNRAATILRAVNSALNQTVSPLEVLVVDDCSSDETVNTIITLFDTRVRVLSMGSNQGAQSARLKGIHEALGTYVVFLDSDDELLPDSIEKRLQSLISSHFTEALVYGDVVRKGKVDKFESLRGYNYPYLLKELSLCPYSAMLIPKCCFSVTGLPEKDFPSWQDDDMALTIGKHFPLLHCGVPVAIMNVDSDGISRNRRTVVEGCRRIVAKYSSDILETHGRFRFFCWQVRIIRGEIIARWFEAKLRLENNLNVLNMLEFLFLTAARFAIRVIVQPFFRHIYG
ncbi:MAG: glycosyltransferase family 2 protein [Desulfuromonadaceae bacterium]